MRGACSIWPLLVISIVLCGCQGAGVSRSPDSKAELKGVVKNLARASNGAFRYHGKMIVTAPSRYRGREIGLFLIAHESDARKYIGKTIGARMTGEQLLQAVEPAADPFSLASPEPQASLELAGETFVPIYYLRYETRVAVQGVVRSYRPEVDKDALFFIFDVGYSGDWASVEVLEPKKYRGLILHVLVYDGLRNEVLRREQWKRIGTQVDFKVLEAALAWEPWGFVPVEQLAEVSFHTEAVPATLER